MQWLRCCKTRVKQQFRRGLNKKCCGGCNQIWNTSQEGQENNQKKGKKISCESGWIR